MIKNCPEQIWLQSLVCVDILYSKLSMITLLPFFICYNSKSSHSCFTDPDFLQSMNRCRKPVGSTQQAEFCLLRVSCRFLAWHTLPPRRWRQCITVKCQLTFNGLHSLISQKIQTFIVFVYHSKYAHNNGGNIEDCFLFVPSQSYIGWAAIYPTKWQTPLWVVGMISRVTKQENMVMSPTGPRIKNVYAGDSQ
jgi:hypothetical protein